MLAIDKDQKCETLVEDSEDVLEELPGDIVNHFDGYSSESEEETSDWTNRVEYNEKLTEDHLVAAAVNYSHGQLPLVNGILCLSDPDLRALDHIPLVHRPLLHPLLALRILYFTLVKFLGQRFIIFQILKSDFRLLFLILLYVFVSAENIFYFFPIVLYYLTFLLMAIATFRMLQVKREFHEFRIWSGLFLTYSAGSLNSEETEFQFICNNLKPYWHFFVALLINLLLYPVIAKQYIAQSELTVVAFCFTFMTLFGFMYKKRTKTVYDFMILFSFAVNVLAKYPYETDPVVTQGWRFLDLKIPTFTSYVIGNGIEFCINFRILLYAFIPVLLWKLAVRQNWQGTYMFLIPHCVTLSWLQIVVISSQGATMFGLIRGTLALVGFVLFLPLVGLTTVFLPSVALTKWLMVNSNFMYSVGTFMIFTAITLVVYSLLSKTTYNKYSSAFQVLFAAIGCYFFLYSFTDTGVSENFYGDESTSKSLTYKMYQKYCHEDNWKNSNTLLMQLKCLQLHDIEITWDGYVQDVTISSVTNKWKFIFDKFPETIRQYLYCYYGGDIKEDCTAEEDPSSCHLLYEVLKSRQKCSLEKFNEYTFNIVIRMQSGLWGKSGEIALEALNPFENFSLALMLNDHIWFKGVLVNRKSTDNKNILDSSRPHVLLKEIGCHSCNNIELTSVSLDEKVRYDFDKIIESVYLSIKCVLNFVFNPIVVFK